MQTAREADSFLSERTRGIYLWYTRGALTETEVVRLMGAACLGWYERIRPRCLGRSPSSLAGKGLFR